MTRKTFDRELRRLEDEMLALGSMVEKAIVESVRCSRSVTWRGRDA